MTLIPFLNQFWKEDSKKPFSANETRLYFFLLHQWIVHGESSFELSTRQIELSLLLPKMTITRARDKLLQRGLIQYSKGDRKVKTPYYFICGVTNDVTNSVTNDVTNPKEKVSPTPPLKENIIKENSSNEELKKAELPSPKPQESCPKTERMDWCAFMQTFNDMLPPEIPKVVSLSETRRKRVKSIIKEYGKPAIMHVFDKIRNSDYLKGRNRKPGDNWRCNFDFIFSPSGFAKILEGNYDNNSYGTENRRANYTSKQEVNEYAMQQFLAKRAAKEQGLVGEVENPF